MIPGFRFQRNVGGALLLHVALQPRLVRGGSFVTYCCTVGWDYLRQCHQRDLRFLADYDVFLLSSPLPELVQSCVRAVTKGVFDAAGGGGERKGKAEALSLDGGRRLFLTFRMPNSIAKRIIELAPAPPPHIGNAPFLLQERYFCDGLKSTMAQNRLLYG